jgi:hypothetical protein
VRSDFWLENAFDKEADIEVEKGTKFRRMAKSFKSMHEFASENSHEPKAFKRSSSTAGERKSAS